LWRSIVEAKPRPAVTDKSELRESEEAGTKSERARESADWTEGRDAVRSQRAEQTIGDDSDA